MKRANQLGVLAGLAAIASVVSTPASADDFWRYQQARYAGLDSASATLRLVVPFGGSDTRKNKPSLGLALSAGSTRAFEDHATYESRFDFYSQTVGPANLTETPFFQTGFTFDGEPFVKLNYIPMTPQTDRLGGFGDFFEGDMDGGELFIAAAIVGAGVALIIYLSGGFDSDDEQEEVLLQTASP